MHSTKKRRPIRTPFLCCKTGDPSRTRTCDPVVKSHLLYRLSYRTTWLTEVNTNSRFYSLSRAMASSRSSQICPCRSSCRSCPVVQKTKPPKKMNERKEKRRECHPTPTALFKTGQVPSECSTARIGCSDREEFPGIQISCIA